MKRVSIVLQLALAVVLTGLWLYWNPLSPDCEDCEGAEDDPFARAVASPSATTVPIDATFEIEHGGCASTRSRSDGALECIFEPGSALRVWVVHPRHDEVEVRVDDRPWGASSYSVEEEPGQGLRIELPEDARRLAVLLPGEEPWTLEVRPSTSLSAAEQLAGERLASAATPLEESLFRGDIEVLPQVEGLIRKAFDQGLLSDAIRLGTAASYYLVENANRPDLAGQVLESLQPAAERYPEGRAFVAIYRGNVAWAEGRSTDAALAYRTGGRYAVRVDTPALKIDALATYARALSEVGYFEAAAHWGMVALEVARSHGRVPDIADVLEVVAEANLRLREAGRTHYDPEPLLRESMALLATDARETGEARLLLAELAVMNGEATVALEHLRSIDLAWLPADRIALIRDLEWQALRMSGASRSELVNALTRLEDAAEDAVGVEPRWRAALRRGTLLEQDGDLEGARAAYEQGEDALDELIRLAALGISAEVTASRRVEGTQSLVALLLRQGRPKEAFCAARQAQARNSRLALLYRRLDAETRAALRPHVEGYLRAKQSYEALLAGEAEMDALAGERARREAAKRRRMLDRFALEILATRSAYTGRPACDDLQPRRPGELILGLYPHRGELLVFAADDRGVSSWSLADYERLVRPDEVEWSGSLLLGPLDERLGRATRVRVLATGEAAAIDVHALPWRDRPLGLQIPVVHGLELPAPSEHPPAHGSRAALVIADPNAEGTEREASRVTEALRRDGWAVLRQSSADLGAQELRRELASVEHFHYAGHAYYDVPGMRAGEERQRAGRESVLRLWPPYPAGAAAEPSYIPLGVTRRPEGGDSIRLDVQDIMMMERVPRAVVLMGCATGVHDERMAHGGFSLATAFVAAGAEAVVASTREVDGRQASLVGRGLYEQGTTNDAGAWLMHALRAAVARGMPEKRVGDYRVYVP